MPSDIPNTLTAEGLACTRGMRPLFADLSFTVGGGELLHVTGANGSGKTSLLRIVCGLSEPESGRVTWRGRDTRRHRAPFLSDVAFLGHANAIKLELSARENVRIAIALSGTAPPEDVDEVLERLDLYGLEEAPASTLSAGQRRRISLARLLIHPVPLWVLDEPFTSLDRAGITLIEALLAQHLAGGGCIVLTSHQPVHLDGVAPKLLHMNA